MPLERHTREGPAPARFGPQHVCLRSDAAGEAYAGVTVAEIRNVWGLSAFLMNNAGVGSFAGTAGIELGG